MRSDIRIERVESNCYRVPTERPESDGTLCWQGTTLILARIWAAGVQGIGYSYADPAAATLMQGKLAGVLIGRSPYDIPRCWELLVGTVRNLGADGIAMLAVSALDSALWDLKARLLDLPLVELIGSVRDSVPAYGSGGFTSYSVSELQQQLGDWVTSGFTRVKMKVGTDARLDPQRVRAAREAIGPEAELFVDANGAYARKEALALAASFAHSGVSWFEEPVPHTDREGLRLVRDRAPEGMEVSSGEYGFTLDYFRDLVTSQAVDVLQADATRCGITGFLQVAALCRGWHLPLSSHCAPALHLHLGCAAAPVRHLEFFHDHARIERMLFDGFVEPVQGVLAPDRSRPGLGLEFRDGEARRFRQ